MDKLSTSSTSTARSSTAAGHSLNISFAYVEGEALMMGINDVAVSSRLGLHLREPRAELRTEGARASATTWPTRRSASASAGSTPRRRSTTSIEKVIEVVRRLREMSPLYEMVKEGRRPLEDPVGGPLIQSAKHGARKIDSDYGEMRHGIQRTRSSTTTRTRATSAASTRTTPTSAPASSARRSAAT